MEAHFKSKGWDLPSDFVINIPEIIEPVFTSYLLIAKTKDTFHTRIKFSEMWTFVVIQFQSMGHHDKLFLTELLIDIDSEWTNYLIEVKNAEHNSRNRVSSNRSTNK